ncbi:NAD(P)/FAD-dependent oxidoreductase [Roseinatronobacter alkalisoli]|uniref:FAD-dependent oxidoreductase n=1 Tax=Roseinatronobacter alkalisoli TaxID=3028235 RepID=A0ABT5TEU6_9RHOB|nr:FAD-dependent oxidoreductase [Roseinatronobacter sp. HJB301]MDD7973628.1 FAD-dependent oxidoreductase [Roseinatronobacter sp. HJB301]
MRIAIFEPLNDQTAASILDGNVLYRPDVAQKGNRDLSRAVFGNDVEGIVVKEWLFNDAFFNECKARNWSLTIILVNKRGLTNAQQAMATRAGVKVICTAPQDGASCYIAGMKALENAIKQDLVAMELYRPVNSRNVTFVGCGLVNLISAYFLASQGYQVSMIDAKADPRSNPSWDALGCSHGGGNARMFTLSEMDNYNCRSVHNDMNNYFSKPITALGWNIFGDTGLNAQEQSWVDEFQSVPVWLADQFNDDILAHNRESWYYWQAWIQKDPALFENSCYKDRILRIYADPTQYQAALARQNRIGATIEVVSAAEVAEAQPSLKEAVANGKIAGGVYVHGFTVKVHAFVLGILARLDAMGVPITWNSPISVLRHTAQGQVSHLIAAGGEQIAVDNLVISPGVYANGLLDSTETAGKICGVLGAWLTLPCLENSLENSLKLARKGHIVEDSNVTISTDASGNPALIIGSGYGFTGFDPDNIDPALLEKMYDGLIDTARTYFPDLYQAHVDKGTLRDSLKYCVRPWTSTSLGVFEMQETADGNKCIVTGGHNTGGFAQSPVIAAAILSAFDGRPHQMHYDYQPARFTRFQLQTQYRQTVAALVA